MLMLLVALACNPPAPPPPPPVPGSLPPPAEVVAKVNGNPLGRDMVDSLKEQLPPQVRQQLAMAGDGPLVEQLIDIELLYRKALADKLQEKPEGQVQLALATRKAMADMALRQAVETRTTDDAAKTWYQDHQVQFARPQIHLSHILSENEADIDAAAKEIASGKAFADVARATSKDPGSAPAGGELGWISQRELPGPLGAAAFGAEVGKPTKFKSEFGWHLLLVDQKRDQTPYEDVQDEVKARMRQEIAEKYLEEIRTGAQIENLAAKPAIPMPGAPGAMPGVPAGMPGAPGAGAPHGAHPPMPPAPPTGAPPAPPAAPPMPQAGK